MAGFVSLGNNRYIGTFKAAVDVKNGQFVDVDYETGTATLGSTYFVQNVNTDVDEFGKNDADFTVKADEYLRLYKPLAGNILVTTEFQEGLAKGDGVVIENGQAVPAGDEDADFVVKDLTTAYGKNAVALLVK